MTIYFGPLESGTSDLGNAAGGLRISGLALGLGGEWAQSWSGYAAGGLRIGGYAEGEVEHGSASPIIPATAAGGVYAGVAIDTFASVYGEADGGVGGRWTAVGYDPAQAWMGTVFGGLQVGGAAVDYAPVNFYGFLIADNPIMAGYAEMDFAIARETFAAGGTPDVLPISVTRERLAVALGKLPIYEGTAAAADALRFGEDLSWTVLVELADSAVFSADPTASFTAIIRVIERMLLSGRAANVPEALAVVQEALVVLALADARHMGVASDTIHLAETIGSVYSQVAAILERILASGQPSPSYTAMVVVREGVVVDAGTTPTEMELAALVRESVGFAANLTFDNGEYIAWVMNTESKGLSRYTQYPFNSFAKVGGRYMGCAPDGLYWLDGDDDDGAKIPAKIRLGLSSLGTRRLKRIPECFIGYTSDGILLLKAIIVDEVTGDRSAAHYRLRPRPASSIRENRFTLGRGLKAVDWDFVIENVDGADFELASIEFRPLLLDRRTRG